jgi:arsenate reductase
MAERVYNVLFLCTGNSARSLLAECALVRWGAARFRAFSAGSLPAPAPHPMTLELLEALGYRTQGLRSKSWREFAGPDAPRLDFVFTVCDAARGEPCPVWPGRPVTAHWGLEDPAAVEGSEALQRRAFRRTYREIERRIRAFVGLAVERLDPLALQRALDAIGRATPEGPRR